MVCPVQGTFKYHAFVLEDRNLHAFLVYEKNMLITAR